MSFLTPLYLLGALAISLPILFHMIRRTPRGRTQFSSVMFLQPSPPKITRRSRIEHWLLLLLRALAVCLLALAFARPFLRESEQQAMEGSEGSSVVILLDTSASMRRAGLWEEASQRLEALLRDEVEPTHQVALLAYDRRPRPIFSFDQWAALDIRQRVDAALSAASEASPTWGASDLGAALIEAAEQLDALQTTEDGHRAREILVLSDLQSGSNVESLQAYDWPKGIPVRLLRIGAEASPNNAGVQVVADASGSDAAPAKQTRLRVTNASGAGREEFQIRWVDQFDPAKSTDRPSPGGEPDVAADEQTVSVIVPGGQSRIVRAAPRPKSPGIGRLVLEGDEHDFDNTCFVPPVRSRSATVAILSDEPENDLKTMRFYLPAALPSLAQRVINVVEWGQSVDDPASEDERPHLVIVTGAIPEAEVDRLRRYLNEGGTILAAAATADDLTGVYALLDLPPVEVSEADVDDYVMLMNIDFSHPLFAALDDSRFSDFTKVRFWKHRVILEDSLPDARTLARFDDGTRALVETRFREGRMIVMTAGWHPDDSQLATSTKFVPMLNGLVDDVAGIVERRTTYFVGESVSLAEFDLTTTAVEGVRTPSGELRALAPDANSFTQTDAPGVYQFVPRETGGGEASLLSFAVNLDPAESRTSPLSDNALVSAGVRLGTPAATPVTDAAAQRQLRAAELEDRQKLWRWLVVAVIAILLAETLLASRAARRQLAS